MARPARRGRRRPVGALLAWALVLGGLAAPVAAQHPATHVEEQAVYDIASRLRCVVCQNLSVADSPSEMANQMRAIVRERLAAGERPEQVIQYFVDRYGEWVLLAPTTEGFNLLVWLAPVAAVLVGFAIAALLLARWTRRGAAARRRSPAAVDAAMAARIRREIEAEP